MILKLQSILSILLVTHTAWTAQTPKICSSPSCISESTRLLQQIDPDVNPCDDFYQFACGKYLKTTVGDEVVEPFKLSVEEAERVILKLYNEPVSKDEHPMVQLEKKVFQACMDNSKTSEEDNLETIKEMLKTVAGGWPLVEGSDWDETKFDWLQATYKLRKLGYPFAIFFEIKVEDDPRNKSASLFQLRISFKFRENLQRLSDKENKIKNIAAALGANIDDISKDLEQMYEFSELLKQQSLQYTSLSLPATETVKDLQQNVESINLLEFINNISGPGVEISSDDYVIVVQARTLRDRMNAILKTSKRAQANYMIWIVLEETIPFLTSDLRNNVLTRDELSASRTSFCLNNVAKRFTPSPVNVMYARKYLPVNRWKPIMEMVWNLRDEFLKGLDKVEWLVKEDKENAKDKAENINVVVGEAGDYFQDTFLDDLNVDMKEIDKENFLNLLSQANRNHISRMYRRINQSLIERKLDRWYMLSTSQNLYYEDRDNLLRLPTSQLQNQIFDENKPNYINYGTLGTKIASQIGSILKWSASSYDKYGNDKRWSPQTMDGFNNIAECLIKNMEIYKKLIFDFVLFELQGNVVGTKLAYDTYKKWVDINGEEPTLPNVNYNPNQLFWIATVVCYPDDDLKGLIDLRDFTRNSAYATARNNPNFAKDFNCPSESEMNPVDKCSMY